MSAEAMSAGPIKLVNLKCNICEVQWQLVGTTSLRITRAEAKKEGWRYLGKDKDTCPKHSPAPPQQEEKVK